jgi:predicted hydrolase (HD superfamily)
MALCEDLGFTREEFLGLALSAMQARAGEIGF